MGINLMCRFLITLLIFVMSNNLIANSLEEDNELGVILAKERSTSYNLCRGYTLNKSFYENEMSLSLFTSYSLKKEQVCLGHEKIFFSSNVTVHNAALVFSFLSDYGVIRDSFLSNFEINYAPKAFEKCNTLICPSSSVAINVVLFNRGLSNNIDIYQIYFSESNARYLMELKVAGRKILEVKSNRLLN